MMDFKDWQGKAVLDRDGHKVGSIGQLYVDDRNDAPAWATVRTNESENFFPVSMAHVHGEDIVIDMPVDDLTHAPQVKADDQIDTDEETELYNYYREKWSDNASGDAADDDSKMDDQNQEKVHIRRYTVTELVTDDGEVQRKEVTIERQPVDEDDMDMSDHEQRMLQEDRSTHDKAGKDNPQE